MTQVFVLICWEELVPVNDSSWFQPRAGSRASHSPVEESSFFTRLAGSSMNPSAHPDHLCPLALLCPGIWAMFYQSWEGSPSGQHQAVWGGVLAVSPLTIEGKLPAIPAWNTSQTWAQWLSPDSDLSHYVWLVRLLSWAPLLMNVFNSGHHS